MANNNIMANSTVMLLFISIIIILLMDSQKRQVQGMKRQRGDEDNSNDLHGHYRPIGESESDFLQAQKRAKIINISDDDDDKKQQEPSRLIGVNPLNKHMMQQFTGEIAEEKETEGQPIRGMFPHRHPLSMNDLFPPLAASNNNNDNNYDSRKGKKVVIDAAAPPPPLNFHGPPATLQWKQHPTFVPTSQQQVIQQQPADHWEEQPQQIDYFQHQQKQTQDQQNQHHLPGANSSQISALTHFQHSHTFLRENVRSSQASLPSQQQLLASQGSQQQFIPSSMSPPPQPAPPPFYRYNNNNKDKNIAVVLPKTGQSTTAHQQQRQLQQQQVEQQHGQQDQQNGQHFAGSTNQSMFSKQFNQHLGQDFINREDQLHPHQKETHNHRGTSSITNNNGYIMAEQQQAAIALLHHRQQQPSFPFNNNEFVTNAHAPASIYAVPSFQEQNGADHSHHQHQPAAFGTSILPPVASTGLAPPLPPVAAALVIEPSHYLVCILPHGSNKAVGTITLWNKSAQPQLYKLRSTDKNMFLFDSSQNLLMPDQFLTINVTVKLLEMAKFAAALKLHLNNLVPGHHITIYNRATDVPLNVMPARQQWKMNRQPDSEWTLAVQFELETVAVNNDHINV